MSHPDVWIMDQFKILGVFVFLLYSILTEIHFSNSEAVFLHMHMYSLRARSLMYRPLITQLGHTVPRPGHQAFTSTHHHRRLSNRCFDGLPNESLDIRPRGQMMHMRVRAPSSDETDGCLLNAQGFC